MQTSSSTWKVFPEPSSFTSEDLRSTCSTRSPIRLIRIRVRFCKSDTPSVTIREVGCSSCVSFCGCCWWFWISSSILINQAKEIGIGWVCLKKKNIGMTVHFLWKSRNLREKEWNQSKGMLIRVNVNSMGCGYRKCV